MKPITITFEKLYEIKGVADQIFPSIENTKFGYAIRKVFKQSFAKHLEEYNDEVDTIRISNALTDKETGALLGINDEHGNKVYEFSPEGTIAFKKAVKELWNVWKDKTIEVTPFEVKDLPELTQEQTELFEGIFIKAEK